MSIVKSRIVGVSWLGTILFGLTKCGSEISKIVGFSLVFLTKQISGFIFTKGLRQGEIKF